MRRTGGAKMAVVCTYLLPEARIKIHDGHLVDAGI
jgi:hypothetical protein